MSSESDVTVFVYLVNEGTDVWRPVKARNIGNGVYALIEPGSSRSDDEEWQFALGSHVRCELRPLDGEPSLVAISQVVS